MQMRSAINRLGEREYFGKTQDIGNQQHEKYEPHRPNDPPPCRQVIDLAIDRGDLIIGQRIHSGSSRIGIYSECLQLLAHILSVKYCTYAFTFKLSCMAGDHLLAADHACLRVWHPQTQT